MPGKGKEDSTPAYCKCKLAEEEKPHPSNYSGCSQAKEEMRRRKIQRSGSSSDRGPAKSSDFAEMAENRSVNTGSNCKQFASG
jgi:hypothetical protein